MAMINGPRDNVKTSLVVALDLAVHDYQPFSHTEYEHT